MFRDVRLQKIKIDPVVKIMQSAYLCDIFREKPKKKTLLALLPCFLILGKIQDGDHFWWFYRPPAAHYP